MTTVFGRFQSLLLVLESLRECGQRFQVAATASSISVGIEVVMAGSSSIEMEESVKDESSIDGKFAAS